MALKPFKKIRTDDPQTNQVQDNVAAFAIQLVQNVDDKVILDPVALTAGKTTQVIHKLGRKPIGWRVIDIDAPARPYSAGKDALLLNLSTDLDCSVTIEVF